MRSEQTPTEEALWRELRGGKLGAVVRRQYVVGRYIADFAVPARRLVQGALLLQPPAAQILLELLHHEAR